jgi:ABC-type glycerol-3-phosphate transport system permease component
LYQWGKNGFLDKRGRAGARPGKMKTMKTMKTGKGESRGKGLGGQYTSDWGEIMAAAILIVAPAVGFFLLMQRRFIQGMAAGSVKG